MALYHVATVTPSKAEIVAGWASTQPWCGADESAIEMIGAYRFDDPEGRVGMEVHLAQAGDTHIQVPLTYRDEPLDGAEDALIGTTEHSVLGTRWVYDGLGDARLVMMLAAVAMTGQGEALGMVNKDGRWCIAPSNVRILGGGWTQERVPVDQFVVEQDNDSNVVLGNDRLEMTVFRNLKPASRPAIGLTATWDGLAAPVVLAEVRDRAT